MLEHKETGEKYNYFSINERTCAFLFKQINETEYMHHYKLISLKKFPNPVLKQIQYGTEIRTRRYSRYILNLINTKTNKPKIVDVYLNVFLVMFKTDELIFEDYWTIRTNYKYV